ncbi:MAG: hypothetical protein Q9163_005751 [Psora crenata]
MPYIHRGPPPPPPSSTNKPPARGRKTAASAATATAALAAVPFDPSGIAILTAVGSGTVALGGLAYHSGHKAVNLIGDRFAKHQAKKANQAFSDSQILVLAHPQADNKLTTNAGDLQTQLESCIRRLSSSITGVVVTGTMTLILPTYLLGLALNGAELMFQAHRLRKLTTLAEQTGGVHRYLSSTDVAFQITSGILIKSAILLCTLGTDVDAFIQGLEHLLVGVEAVVAPDLISDTLQQTGHAGELYDGLIAHDFLQSATQVAGEPADVVAGLLGYDHIPTWHTGAPEEDILGMGAANVAVDLVAGKLVENPTHELLDFASRLGRKYGWRGSNSSRAQ